MYLLMDMGTSNTRLWLCDGDRIIGFAGGHSVWEATSDFWCLRISAGTDIGKKQTVVAVCFCFLRCTDKL